MNSLLKFVSNSSKYNYKCNVYKTYFNRPFSQRKLDVNTNVVKDVLLYKSENERYFRSMNMFGIAQFCFWTYLAFFAFKSLRNVPVDRSKEITWWRKINLGENKYRNGLSIIAFTLGWGILAITWVYTLRSVKYIILRKGGKELTIVTYTPYGQKRMFTLGLENISAKEARSAGKMYLPIKVKGHYLHYMVDMKGEFRNTNLFDHTAGLRRDWKK